LHRNKKATQNEVAFLFFPKRNFSWLLPSFHRLLCNQIALVCIRWLRQELMYRSGKQNNCSNRCCIYNIRICYKKLQITLRPAAIKAKNNFFIIVVFGFSMLQK